MTCAHARSALSLLLAATLLTGCGDEELLVLEDRVDLELFSEIDRTLDGPRTTTQIATVVLSPTFSRADVDKITRVRLIDRFDREWVLSEDPAFTAADEGWVLSDERTASQGFTPGPWDLRMVVEEEGVFEHDHQQGFPPVPAPSITEASVTPAGEVSIGWPVGSVLYQWTLEIVQLSSGEETVHYSVTGEGRGGGSVDVSVDVPPASFEAPNELIYRLVVQNRVSRLVLEGYIVPTG